MNLTTFNFKDNAIRSMMDEQGNPWFVAADVCAVLEIGNVSQAMTRLDDDEKVDITTSGTSSNGVTQKRNMTTISESGLYSLILTSRKPSAANFRKWLVSEVLPAIKDTNSIIEALNNFEVPDDIPDMFVYAIKNTDTGNIKLGISKNPEQRLKQLQTGCDGKLELIAYRKADNRYQDELQLHTENKQYAIHGEWFTEEAKFN